MAIFYINKILPEKEYVDVYVNGHLLDEYQDVFESHSGLVHIKAVHRRPFAHEDKAGKEVVARHFKRGDEACKYESLMPPYFCVTETNIMPEDEKVFIEVKLEKSKVFLKAEGGQMVDYKSRFDITGRALRRGIIYGLAYIILVPILLFFGAVGVGVFIGESYSDLWTYIDIALVGLIALFVLIVQLYHIIRSICIYVKNKPQR